MTTIDIKLQNCLGMVPGKTTYTIRGFRKIVTERLRSNYVSTHKTPIITPGIEVLLTIHSEYFFLKPDAANPRFSKPYLKYPKIPYGALPETPPKTPKILVSDTIRSLYKLFQLL